MAGTYYKYAERDADSQINWAEVGKTTADMLSEFNRVREEKKSAYEQATRESLNNLENSPQGKNQDVNGIVNNFAHDLINQKKIDYDLFKRGMMTEREYTLKMQNQMDGTKRVFDISKALQDSRQATLDGIASGELQTGINVFNRGMVEKYQDLSKLKIVNNPHDGTISLGLLEDKVIDGKTVRVLSGDIADVNVILGKIAQTVPSFDVNAANKNFVQGLGSKVDAAYTAATTSRAGTITALMGQDFLKTVKDPAVKAIVENTDDALNAQVGSYFSDEHKLMGVLTENLGKYNSDSFTFDRKVADADENKILVKVNDSTGQTSLDETGKNYLKQKEEAASYVKTDMLAKMDASRKIDTTTQLQAQYAPQYVKEAKDKAKIQENALGTWNDVLTATTPEAKKIALTTVLSTQAAKDRGIIDVDVSTPGKIIFKNIDPRFNIEKDFDFKTGTLGEWAAIGNEIHGIDDVGVVMKRNKGGNPNMRANPSQQTFTGVSAGYTPVVDTSLITPELFTVKSVISTEALQGILPETFTVTDKGGWTTNDVEVVAPNKKIFNYNANLTDAQAALQAPKLAKFIAENYTNKEETNTKEIKRADIAAKAKASGYSVKEYEALLIKNGVTIK